MNARSEVRFGETACEVCRHACMSRLTRFDKSMWANKSGGDVGWGLRFVNGRSRIAAFPELEMPHRDFTLIR